jgi:hypothetical protein
MATDLELSYSLALALISLRGRWIEFGQKAVLVLPSGMAWVHKGQTERGNCSWAVWSGRDFKAFRERYKDPDDFVLSYDEAKQRAARALLFAKKRE